MIFRYQCQDCGRIYPPETREWRCHCGGAFVLEKSLPFSKELIDKGLDSMWRYRAMLPVDSPISLGEGGTPMVDAQIHTVNALLKLEYLAPTGSFKDRGASLLVGALAQVGIEEVVEDSSGNAGASLAAYAARAGIEAHIYTPAHASPAKLGQISAYGATLHTIEGPREEAAHAVVATADKYYRASHYWNPLSMEGFKTIAYEIAEDLSWRAPENIVLPVGHGTLLLGIYRGFADLLQARLIDKLPHLFAVQAKACAPIYEAFEGLRPSPIGRTVAEGINIAQPVRLSQVTHAIRATEGDMTTVEEEEILRGQDILAHLGLLVEPTSAVPLAALPHLAPSLRTGVTVIPLTGSGLKSLCQT